MGGPDRRFWIVFGSIWLVVGLGWLIGSLVAQFFFGGAGKESALLWVCTGMGFALSAAGGVIVRRGLRAGAREQRLRSAGIRLEATVVEVRPGLVRVNREPRWIVRYRYAYGAGQEFEGESPALPAELAQKWRPGDRVAVMSDPRRPSDSLWLDEAD